MASVLLVLYETPTPLEGAYASYLLSQYLGGTFPISGKIAVAFLTTSQGVSRGTLRDIWNAVDPNQDGKLHTPSQWWTVLKLIAIAQQQPPQFDQSSKSVQSLMPQLQSTTIPLPVFDPNTVPIPCCDVLMQQYYHGGQITEPSFATTAPISLTEALDALGSVHDAPLPALGQQSYVDDFITANDDDDDDDDDGFGDFADAPPALETEKFEQPQVTAKGGGEQVDLVAGFGTAPSEPISLSSALDSLGSSHDVPLPALGGQPYVEDFVPMNENDAVDFDDFGDFADAPPTLKSQAAEQNDLTGGFSSTPSEPIPLSNALDELGPLHDAPLPALGGQAYDGEDLVPASDEDDDNSGDYADAPPNMTIEQPTCDGEPQQQYELSAGFSTTPSEPIPLSKALDALGAVNDMPLPALGAYVEENTPALTNNDAEDDFGGFADARPTLKRQTLEQIGEAEQQDELDAGFGTAPSEPIPPLSSALDALGAVHDVPLQALGAYVEENTPPFTNDDDVDDDFGDFTDAPPARNGKTLEQNKEVQQQEELAAGFCTAPSEPIPLSSALDALGCVHDMPLPALGSYIEDALPVNDEDDDDDFGDFTDAPPNMTSEENRESQQDELTGVFNTTPSEPIPLSNALDGLSAVHDTPLPVLGQPYAENDAPPLTNDEDHDSGNFADAPSPTLTADAMESTEGTSQPKAPQTNGEQEETKGGSLFTTAFNEPIPLSSALDALGPVHDVPLPPLCQILAKDATPANDDVDDDFGDFSDAPPSVDSAVCEPSATEPLQQFPFSNDLSQVRKVSTLPEKDNAQGFGGVVEEVGGDGLSAFDALGPVQDAPLRSLESLAVAEVEDENNYGEFENSPKEATLLEGGDRLASGGDESTPQAFEAAQRVHEDLYDDDDDDDDFGEFKDAPTELESELADGECLDRSAAPPPIDEQGLGHDFGGCEHAPKGAIQNVPAPLLGDVVVSDEGTGDNFDGVKEATEAQPSLKRESSAESTDLNRQMSSAFDALTPVKDVPLKPLDAFRTQDAEQDDSDVDDSFGDFEDASEDAVVAESAENTSKVPAGEEEIKTNDEVPFSSAFDGISQVQDAPLPPISMAATEPTEDVLKDDDFEDAPTAAETTAATGSRGPEKDVLQNGTQNEPESARYTGDRHAEFADSSNEPPLPNDDFGDFENALETAPEDAMRKVEESGNAELHFGDANEALDEEIEAYVTGASALLDVDVNDDPFAAFAASTDAPLPVFHTTYSSDEFNGSDVVSDKFNGYKETVKEADDVPAESVPIATSLSEVLADDSFGDFVTTADPLKDDRAESGGKQEALEDGDFGDFTTVEAPTEAGVHDNFDAVWGDFEQVEHANVSSDTDENAEFGTFASVPAPKTVDDHNFGNFGLFQVETSHSKEEQSLEEMRKDVLKMQTKLRLLNRSAGKIDVVKSFDSHLMSGGASTKTIQRARRCVHAMSLVLTSSHGNLTSHWEKVLSVVRDELAMGSILLEEAKDLLQDKTVRTALGTFIAGLAEYVRVVRFIVATIGDLLAMSGDADLKVWPNDLTLLECALEVEELWTTIEHGAINRLNLKVPSLETVVDIRTKSVEDFSNENFCQLTLQPLSSSNAGTTQSRVEWQGKAFMACAANFWANRISTTMPE